MNILGIVASPRREGNTQILVEEALKAAHDLGAKTDLWSVSGKNLSGCLACGGCYASGACVQQDDMKTLYPLLLNADGIVFGSPVYFLSVTAQAKAIMDRCFCLFVQEALKGKIGSAIVSTIIRGAFQTLQIIHGWFLAQGMVLGGNYGALTTGFCENVEKGSLKTSGTRPDGKTPINDPWLQAQACGRQMVELAHSRNAP